MLVNGDPNPNRPDLPHYGAGETSHKPMIAAVANAIYDATGVRLRRAPFRKERVLAALRAASVLKRLLFGELDQQNASNANIGRSGIALGAGPRLEGARMQAKNSYLLIGVAAAATAFASAAFAGGEAGKLELRDFGAKFVGYTTRSARQRLARRAEPAVRPVPAAGAPAARAPDRLHPRRRRPRYRLARDARRPRRLGRLFRRRRLGRLRRRPAGPRPFSEQRELRQRHGARR